MKILEELEQAVVEGWRDSNSSDPQKMANNPGVVELVKQALSDGIYLDDILQKGLIVGMDIVGQKFSKGEYFLPNLLMSAQAMKGGMAILEPLFESSDIKLVGKVIIGTVKGDMHDIGKNLVSVILQGGGYEIIDLGVDVSSQQFVDVAKDNPDAVVGMSALLTTTKNEIGVTLDRLRGEGLKNKVIIGGAVVTSEYAKEIGADAFTTDAAQAVNIVNDLTDT
jgi:5-methyltetrahydrofolate--homocysteine methyltransferase